MSGMMKQQKLVDKHKFALEEVPIPEPDGFHVILKVNKCGICGSEAHVVYDTGDQWPFKDFVPGHEFSGVVVDPGNRTDLKVGDRVVPAANIGCGTCELCRRGLSNICQTFNLIWGGFGEYAAMDPRSIFLLPDEMSFTQAAIIEPVAVCTRAVARARIENGENVLVLGSGIIGSVCAKLARNNGATVGMQEINMDRAKAALERGDCDMIFNALDEDVVDQMKAATGGKGWDKIIECSGAKSSYNGALDVLRMGGTIIMVGAGNGDFPIRTRQAIEAEQSFLGSYSYTYRDWVNAMKLINTGVVDADKYATRSISLEEVPDAFEKLRSGAYADTKVIIDYDPSTK